MTLAVTVTPNVLVRAPQRVSPLGRRVSFPSRPSFAPRASSDDDTQISSGKSSLEALDRLLSSVRQGRAGGAARDLGEHLIVEGMGDRRREAIGDRGGATRSRTPLLRSCDSRAPQRRLFCQNPRRSKPSEEPTGQRFHCLTFQRGSKAPRRWPRQ